MSSHCTLQIRRGNEWHNAASVEVDSTGTGYLGGCVFSYDGNYAAEHGGPTSASAASVSCRYPVDFTIQRSDVWPAFLLDILPSGYGRDQWIRRLGIRDGASADWPLLITATAFPPGNLRIAEAAEQRDTDASVPTSEGNRVRMKDHPGFNKTDVIGRTEHFVEYAFQHGIYAAGASDVQGVAPKMLLNEATDGTFHAEGRLDEPDIKQHWLLKRPRGSNPVDRQILRLEAAYMNIAQHLGLNVHASLHWEADSLFVPRFDRRVDGASIHYFGLESLTSLAGVSDYGKSIPHEELVLSLINHSSNPETDLIEYIKRDVTNVLLGNTDNHSRNSAILRHEDGTTRLSPLFDFAPMYLDPAGIPRASRWSREIDNGGQPIWEDVVRLYEAQFPALRAALSEFANTISVLPKMLLEADVDTDVIDLRQQRIEQNAMSLSTL